MIILLHLLNDNQDHVTVFNRSSECDVLFPSPVVYKYEPYTQCLTSLKIHNNNKKDCQALAKKNRPRRLINAKLERKKTQNMRRRKKVNANELFSPSGQRISASYVQMLIQCSISYRHIWRKYPAITLQIRNREYLLAKSRIE